MSVVGHLLPSHSGRPQKTTHLAQIFPFAFQCAKGLILSH